GDYCEAPHHVALNDVAVRAARRILPLGSQNSILISVIRRRAAFVSLIPRLLHDRSERALRLAGFSVPVEAVFLPGGADELFRVVVQTIFVQIFHGVLALGVDDREQGVDREQLVLADAAVENLFAALFGIEPPLAAFLHQRNREGPVVFAQDENRVVPFL